MFIDIIVVVLLVIAIFKGISKGLIIGIFSFLAVIIGLAAAIKLSAVAASYLGDNVNISQRWLPVIAFAVVFIVVILLVRLGAKALKKYCKNGYAWLAEQTGRCFLFFIDLSVYFQHYTVLCK